MDFSKFIMLADPKPFSFYIKDRDYEVVQVFSNEPAGDDIVGFCGQFSWINNKLTPLDGDSYNEDVIVLGFREWEKDNIIGLDILVGDDW